MTTQLYCWPASQHGANLWNLGQGRNLPTLWINPSSLENQSTSFKLSLPSQAGWCRLNRLKLCWFLMIIQKVVPPLAKKIDEGLRWTPSRADTNDPNTIGIGRIVAARWFVCSAGICCHDQTREPQGVMSWGQYYQLLCVAEYRVFLTLLNR